MALLKLKYVERYYDRHGKERCYLRHPSGSRVALPTPFGSEPFLAAYRAAMDQISEAPKPAKSKTVPRSLRAAIVEYKQLPMYVALAPGTKSAYNGPLQWLEQNYGDQLMSELRPVDVDKIMARKQQDGPAAANSVLKVLRLLVKVSMRLEWRATDPTTLAKKFREGEHRAWTDQEMAAFEARWSVGTPERLGYALALFTGQRRADVAAMTWADVDPLRRTVRVVQEKTGTKLTIPLHSELWAVLQAHPRDKVSLMPTMRGGRYTTESFGNLMADAIKGAGLSRECVLHGLRKAAGMRLADVGCSAKEIMAILGHTTLSQATHYTKHADQIRLAEAAINRLEKGRR